MIIQLINISFKHARLVVDCIHLSRVYLINWQLSVYLPLLSTQSLVFLFSKLFFSYYQILYPLFFTPSTLLEN